MAYLGKQPPDPNGPFGRPQIIIGQKRPDNLKKPSPPTNNEEPKAEISPSKPVSP